MSNQNTNTEPSTLTGNLKAGAGYVVETAGAAIGHTGLQQQGKELRDAGNKEYQEAQAQNYAQGAADRVSGKIDNVVGAVTGDKELQASGQANHDKGKLQMDLSDPAGKAV